jgi:hypothetical protein
MFRTPGRILFFFAVVCALPAAVMGQANMPYVEAPTFRAIFGRVTNIKDEPIAGAAVEILTNGGAHPPQFVDTNPDGTFRIDFTFLHDEEFTAVVTVAKKGFPKAHSYANYDKSGVPTPMFVLLRQPQNDPDLLSESDLVSRLAPRFRTLGPSDGLSVKDLKNYEKAAVQFLDKNQMDLAVPVFETVAMTAPACVRCRLMAALAELQWGDWHDSQHNFATAVNAAIANRQLGIPEAFLAYGVLMSWEHDPDKAGPYLEAAVRDAPHDALALQELGRAQCQTMNWEGAKDTLAKALAAGAGPATRLMYAEALVWAGTAKDAEAEMIRYLDGRDLKKMPPRVRTIWDEVQERKHDDTALVKLQKRSAPYIDYFDNPPAELQKVDPAGDGVNLSSILAAVGKNISDLFEKFPNTSSLEVIHQEKLDRKGNSEGKLNQRFRYLCLVPNGQWGPRTDEYRADSTGQLATPDGVSEDFMLTTGFVAAPLIFHPIYQPGSGFKLLGRQKVQGHDAYVVTFAQNPAKARMFGNFRAGDASRLTFFQGAAWIDASTYQILRLRTDLLSPLPAVKLQTEKTDIEFSEVHFTRTAQSFWLPSQVTVDLDWQGRRLRNHHEYSNFIEFNVDSYQKIAKPKNALLESTDGQLVPAASP